MKKIIIGVAISILLIFGSIFGGSKEMVPLFTLFIAPFNLMGQFLRNLSLSSSFGNIVSIILYIILSSIVTLFFGFKSIKKRIVLWEVILLLLLGISNFFVLYYYINPHLIKDLFNNNITSDQILSNQKVGITFTFYSVLFLYIGLKVIYSKIDSKKLLNVFIYSLIIIILINGFYVELSYFIKKLDNATTMQLIINISKYIYSLGIESLVVIILLRFGNVVSYLDKENIDFKLIYETNKLSKYVKILIIFILLEEVIYNILNIVFRNLINQYDFSLSLPITNLFVLFIILLLSKHFLKSYKISEENRLTI